MHLRSLRPRSGADALTLAKKVWEAIDTPRSLALHIAANYGQWDEVLRLKIVDPLNYLAAPDFFVDYQASRLLSKSVELPTGIDKRMVAAKKFIESEAQCKKTNEFFRSISEGTLKMVPRIERVLSNARTIIANILGPRPSFERLDFAFGPGASLGVRKDTSVYKKVTSDLECTYALAASLPDIFAECPGLFTDQSYSVELVRGGELTFVPKDATTDRPICIEPLLNGFVQKGIGSYIRDRLSNFGVDLKDQTINQRLAEQALGRGLATMDLTSASDTVSYLLVMELLPWDWFQLLDSARSPNFRVDGRWFSFQKFSSMGNAYTFELESLIFYALACATCKEVGVSYSTQSNLHVFGDDIIVPAVAFDLLTQVMSACGFEVNLTKSFCSGPFFESCGTDYFLGCLVRPIFFKEKIGTQMLRWFYATNSIRRIQSKLESLLGYQHRYPWRYSDHRGVVSRLDVVHGWMVAQVPKRLRFYGPEGFGDGHLIAEWDECTPKLHPHYEGWIYRSIREQPVTVPLRDCPTGYALYFNRECLSQVDRERRGDDRYVSRFPFEIEDQALPRPHGDGYDLRGRTKVVISNSFCASAWKGWRTTVGYECTIGAPARMPHRSAA